MLAVGLLDGDLQSAIYEGFRGRLLSGALRRQVTGESTALDSHGDPIDLAPELIPLEGFIDYYSAFARAQAGIPDTDLKVCILAGSAPSLTPRLGNQVRFDFATGARWFEIKGPCDTDPATALWVCRSFECEAPL